MSESLDSNIYFLEESECFSIFKKLLMLIEIWLEASIRDIAMNIIMDQNGFNTGQIWDQILLGGG